MVKSRKVIFRKSQKLLTERAPMEAAYSEHSIAIYSISMVGYVNAIPAFVCFEAPSPRGQAVSVIFENLPLAISSHLSPL